jgi:hypothetical protein
MTIVTCITVLRTANEGTVLLKSARITKQSEKSNSNVIMDSQTPPMFPDVNLHNGNRSPSALLTSKKSDLMTLSKQTSGGVIPLLPEDQGLPALGNENAVHPSF